MSIRAAFACAAVLLAAAPALIPVRLAGAQEAWAQQAGAQQAGAPQTAAQESVPTAPAASEAASENAPATPDDSILPIPPVPPRIAEGVEYDRCLDMLPDDPSGADALAATLAASGASEAAQHCHALAQVELGNSAAGAALLDHLAAASTAAPASRAVVFGQADRAWTMAGDATQAYASASRALALSPEDPELLIGHAIAGMALKNCAEAEADLGHALALDPRRADALTLRATARRCLGRLDEAQADIDHALALDDDDADALLERGIIRQRRGNLDGARQDWEHAAELAPDSPTADLAEQNLALLDAGPRQ